MPDELDRNQKQWSWLTLLGIVVLVLAVLVFYFGRARPHDYIILGVPYFGTFSGTPLTNDVKSTAAMILRYWGDKRLSLYDIADHFPSKRIREGFTINDFRKFFDEQGYETLLVELASQKDLEKFINKNANLPVIITLQRSGANSLNAHSFAVIIGSLESSGSVVLHETDLGNNYYLPAKNLFDKKQPALIVKPSSKNQAFINGPNNLISYPNRLPIMDDQGIRKLLDLWAATNVLAGERRKVASGGGNTQNIDQRLLESWQTITADINFKKLHPAGQVAAYTAIGMYLTRWGRYDEAIKILANKALPINKNLNRPANGWPHDTRAIRSYATPWRLLGYAYLGKNKKDKADQAFKAAVATGDRTSSGYLEPEIKKIVNKL